MFRRPVRQCRQGAPFDEILQRGTERETLRPNGIKPFGWMQRVGKQGYAAEAGERHEIRPGLIGCGSQTQTVLRPRQQVIAIGRNREIRQQRQAFAELSGGIGEAKYEAVGTQRGPPCCYKARHTNRPRRPAR